MTDGVLYAGVIAAIILGMGGTIVGGLALIRFNEIKEQLEKASDDSDRALKASGEAHEKADRAMDLAIDAISSVADFDETASVTHGRHAR